MIEIIIAMCSVITGGGLTALLTVIFNRNKQKYDEKHRDIDDRIMAWQQIADHNENRFTVLEKRLGDYQTRIALLEKYILELERIIIKLNPLLELPKHPEF